MVIKKQGGDEIRPSVRFFFVSHTYLSFTRASFSNLVTNLATCSNRSVKCGDKQFCKTGFHYISTIVMVSSSGTASQQGQGYLGPMHLLTFISLFYLVGPWYIAQSSMVNPPLLFRRKQGKNYCGYSTDFIAKFFLQSCHQI